MAAVLGVLQDPYATTALVSSLRKAGFKDLEVYSPVPSPEIEEALERGPSAVRGWTFVGAISGVCLGYLMTIWMSYNWPMVIGGKPFASIPPYTVIAFELTILFGGVLTVLGFFVHGLLLGPADRGGAYRPSFSGDEFGCLVSCGADQIKHVQDLLNTSGCKEVRVLEG
jgi:hypothetical protein